MKYLYVLLALFCILLSEYVAREEITGTGQLAVLVPVTAGILAGYFVIMAVKAHKRNSANPY